MSLGLNLTKAKKRKKYQEGTSAEWDFDLLG